MKYVSVFSGYVPILTGPKRGHGPLGFPRLPPGSATGSLQDEPTFASHHLTASPCYLGYRDLEVSTRRRSRTKNSQGTAD